VVLDHHLAEPLDDAMAAAMATAVTKDRVLMAAMAGRAGTGTEDTVASGRALEERARADHRPLRAASDHRGSGLLQRIRAHGAA
jgi:hypothetical protein